MESEEKGKGNERWEAAITNLTEMSGNLESLQKLLLKKAVFVDQDTFYKASLASSHARTIKVLSLLDYLFNLFPILFVFFFFDSIIYLHCLSMC